MDPHYYKYSWKTWYPTFMERHYIHLGNNDWNSQNKLWNRENNDLCFCCTIVPIWKALYIQTVAHFLKKHPVETQRITENGKVHNRQSTICQIIQSRYLLHFAYHNIKTSNSLFPVPLTIHRLPHFQVSSQLVHHQLITDTWVNLIIFNLKFYRQIQR